jgi:putative ABC transport system permease protein
MGIPLVAGRDFAATDADSGAAPVVIINQTAAATILHAANPVGRRIDFSGGKGPFVTIVGVVRDVHDASLREAPRAQVFLSTEQSPPSAASLAVHYSGDADAVIMSIRRIARSLDVTVPVFGIMTVDQVLDRASVADRFTMSLLSGFSALALLLAALGTYGVMAFGVTERTREIGVRMALGARGQDVSAMVLREGLVLLVVALPIALLGVWASTGVLRSLLYGVAATDPTTIVVAVAAAAAATLVACYVPARRAARVDPVAAIRGTDVL